MRTSRCAASRRTLALLDDNEAIRESLREASVSLPRAPRSSAVSRANPVVACSSALCVSPPCRGARNLALQRQNLTAIERKHRANPSRRTLVRIPLRVMLRTALDEEVQTIQDVAPQRNHCRAGARVTGPGRRRGIRREPALWSLEPGDLRPADPDHLPPLLFVPLTHRCAGAGDSAAGDLEARAVVLRT